MIVLVWASGIAVLLVLQTLGFGVGLRVHPLAEDRYLIRLMTNYHWSEVPWQFWERVESRNPLAPWWYLAFSPLIFFRPEGLYLLRKLVDLFLAGSVYLLIDKIGRGKLSKFAFACGVLVLFWNFSGYIEQILWLTLLSLGLSILSVYFYCRYLDSDRTTADDFVVSLLLFFVALATYSIQCGAPIAVFLLGLFRRQETAEGRRWSSAVGGAIKDTLFYGVVFLLFMQIWISTAAPMAGYFHPEVFLKQFVDSATNLVWHRDTSYFIDSLSRLWPLQLVLATFGVSAILFYCLFAVFARKVATRPGEGSSVPYLVLVLAVFCALVAPTLLLESTTAIWAPGTRSRMVQQGFQPIFYLSIFFLLTEYLGRRMGQGVEYVRHAGIALLCALAVVIGLDYNRRLSQQTLFEHKFETGLKKVMPAMVKPTHFLVKMKGMEWGSWYSGFTVSMPSLFVKTAYNYDSVWLDPVYEGGPRGAKPVTFGSDQQGIYSPESGGWVPYQDVVFLEFDGHKVTQLTKIDQQTFSGYGAIYAREQPPVPGL